MQDNPYILGFTAGELSPWLSTRFDLPQHRKGAARIENFLVEPFGGVSRRRGSRFKAMAYDQQGRSRFFPFTFSEDDYLLLEIYPGGIRFWKDDDWLRNDSGAIYTLSTTWVNGDVIKNLRFIQVNDVIFATGSSIYPTQIKRISEDLWTFELCDFSPMPKGANIVTHNSARMYLVNEETREYVLDLPDDYPLPYIPPSSTEAADYVMVKAHMPSRDYYLNYTATITPKVITSLFNMDSYEPGQILAIYQERTAQYHFYTVIRSWSFTDRGESTDPASYPTFFTPGAAWSYHGNTLFVPGGWRLETSGTWDSSWELWRSYPPVNSAYIDNYRYWDWHRVHYYSQSSYQDRKNWAFSGYEKVPSHMIVVCLSSRVFNLVSPMCLYLDSASYDVKMSVMGNYNYGQRRLRLRLEDPLVTLPTDFYPEEVCFSAFGMMNGYPSFCGMHEGRLWLGGTQAQPTTLRASALDDFYNFQLGSDANDSLELTLASSKQSRMCWMSTERGLLLGTSDAEWLLSSGDSGGISPTSASFRKESTVGSENKEAHGVENSVFYVQRGGKRLREISYKLESDGYTSTDTSLLAEHLFESGIKEWSVQRGSSTRVWVLMEDSTLAVLTTNVAQQVTAWQRVSFKGAEVLHIACMVTRENHDDDVWLVIRRGESVTLECIEDESVYLDSYVRVTLSDGALTIPHLADMDILYYPEEDVTQLAGACVGSDGRVLVEGGEEGKVYIVGIAMSSQLETFPVEQGSSYNTVSQQARVKLRLLNSDPSFSYRATHVERWERYDPERDQLSYPYTGAVRVTQIPDPGVGQGFALATESVRPFNLLSLSIENDFHGR